MKLLGILRASALCLLVSAFHGPRGVFCSNLEVDLSNESSTVEVSDVSENLEDSTVNTGGGSEGDLAAQVKMLQEKLQALEAGLDKVPKESSTDDINDSTVESLSEASSPASQSDLVFENSTWDDSMLASTFLFIEEFCQEVKAEKFKGKISAGNMKDLSKKCANLSSYVGSFIHRFKPTYGPGSVTERKEIPMDFYKDALKAEQFQVYVRWLAENNWEIWASVKQMFRDSLKLSKEQLKTETSRGPLRYGFVYTGKPWGELTHGVNRGFFKGPTILQSFNDLKSSLDDILKSFPKDSTVKSQAA
ncbi:secreted antigen 1 [Babesia divergens]|uniref:Secreted antigen 1 n=1 Tax=Babesia divergens TaxID=32595 RepID=A0AAD9GE53_BABDI|nr:secreted antigen 1 [Babesia divergens]